MKHENYIRNAMDILVKQGKISYYEYNETTHTLNYVPIVPVEYIKIQYDFTPDSEVNYG